LDASLLDPRGRRLEGFINTVTGIDSKRAPSGLARDVVIYGIGGSAAQIVNIAFLPIFTRIFTPGEFGALDFLLTVNAMGSLFALAGLNSSVFYRYRQIDDVTERRSTVGTGLMLSLAFGGVIAIVGAIMAGPIASGMGLVEALVPAVALTFIWVPVNVVGTLALDLLRLEFRPIPYSLLGVGRAVFAGVVGAFLAGPLGLGVAGLLLAYVLFGIAGVVITLWLARATWAPRFQTVAARKLLDFGLPLIPTGLAYWVISYSDRFFLIQLIGIGSAGIYAVANRVSLGVQLVLYAFEAAWWPYAYARARELGHREQFAQIFTVVVIGTLGLAVLLGLFAREILLVITTPEFVPAYAYVGLLALSLVVHGAYGVISIGVQLGERTRHMAWTSGAAALANIALNVLLIPRLGIAGAALATLAAYTTSTVLLFVLAQRAYPMPYRLAPIAGAVAVNVALMLSGLVLDATAQGVTWVPVITLAKAGLAIAATVLAVALLRSRLHCLIPELHRRPS
jgi:O-antigen/teichoic acid export membrane protein